MISRIQLQSSLRHRVVALGQRGLRCAAASTSGCRHTSNDMVASSGPSSLKQQRYICSDSSNHYAELTASIHDSKVEETSEATTPFLRLGRTSANRALSSLVGSSIHHASSTTTRRRQFHSCATRLEEKGDKDLSWKEKKKLMKEKAKAAMAEAASKEKEEDEAAPAEEEAKSKEETPKDKPEEVKTESPKEEAAPAKEEVKAAATPPMTEEEATEEYSSPELTQDAAKHKAGLYDEDRPTWQNPLHHNNPDKQKIFREDFDSDEEFEKARKHETQRLPPLQVADEVVAPPYLHELANEMVNLTMLEMNELVNKLQDHYGFPDDMMEPDGDGGEGGDDDDDDEGGEAKEEKTAFDLKLVSFDAKAKIKVIKEVRAIAGLGLKEAKEVVEGAPSTIQKDVKKEEAEATKAKLEELGAVVEIV